MNKVNIKSNEVTVNGMVFKMPYSIQDAFVTKGILVVLLDPDSYLADENYKTEYRQSRIALHNLQGFDLNGNRIWQAEFPNDIDYYYKVSSHEPLEVYSFSSFVCQIDPASGRILSKTFLK